MARSKKSKSSVVTVNFKGVESGGRSVPDGWYHAEIKAVKKEEAESGNEMLVFQYSVSKGKLKALVYDNCVLVPQSLFRLKNVLEAVGMEVPEEDDLDLNLKELVGMELEVEIINEKYEGRDRSKVAGVRAAGGDAEEEEEEDDKDDDDEEEEKSSKKSKKSKKKDDDEEEEEEEEEEDDEPKKKKKKKSKDEDEEEEEDDDEDDEEEEDDDDDKKSKKKPKLKSGQKVKFKDGDGNWVKGVITSIDDDDIHVEDKDGDDWSLDRTEDEIVGL